MFGDVMFVVQTAGNSFPSWGQEPGSVCTGLRRLKGLRVPEDVQLQQVLLQATASGDSVSEASSGYGRN